MVKMQKLNSETYLVEIRCTNSFQVSRNKLQHQFFACPIVKSIFMSNLFHNISEVLVSEVFSAGKIDVQQ